MGWLHPVQSDGLGDFSLHANCLQTLSPSNTTLGWDSVGHWTGNWQLLGWMVNGSVTGSIRWELP